MLVMGLGYDGHFCGNLPGKTAWEDQTVKTPFLDEELQKIADLEFGGDVSLVPSYAVTMGPRSVMNVKELIMIVNGKHKADILKQTVEGKVDSNIPSTILKLHPNLTIITDEDAASCLSEETLEKYR